MSGIPLVDVIAQNDECRTEIGREIGAVVSNGNFILGPSVWEFEQAFAEFCGTRHAVGVACGLDALSLSLAALGVGHGDDVLVPANSFVASAQAVLRVGATPVFVDCDPVSYCMNAADAEKAVTPFTKAIMPVHLYGQCADMESVLDVADKHSLYVVEDACQAHGARRNGQRAGSLGDVGCFSFYPAKNLGAFGDGGCVVTDDDGVALNIRRLRNYGQEGKYNHVAPGVNSRLDSIQAAVLSCKLKRLDKWNQMRRVYAAVYKEVLGAHERITVPAVMPGNEHVWHLYVIGIDGLTSESRTELIAKARDRGISLGIHYPTPIHKQAYFASNPISPDRKLPVAEAVAEDIVSLPMYPHLGSDRARRVAETMLEII